MYLGKNLDRLEKEKALYTAKEICQQGAVWKKLSGILESLEPDFISKLAEISQDKEAQIILSGAGTSAYIGNILATALDKTCKAQVRSLPTTDIVSQPGHYFHKKSQGVVISFGRSGNSPESIDAVEKIEQVSPDMHHIYVTCNMKGALAQRAKRNSKIYLCLMPEEAHDVSFVMTSSFSSMLLFTYGLFEKAIFSCLSFDYDVLAKQSNAIAEAFHENHLFNLLPDIKRIVFLGSNILLGAAQESALKAVEMTQGEIITMAETSLGFRHGPKSIINNKTMVCVFVSGDTYTQLFDKDIINELIAEGDIAQLLIFAPAAFFETYEFKDSKVTKVSYGKELDGYNDALLGALFVNYAQIIGLYMAVHLGYSPDNPCPTGQVNRVVQGVTLYDYPKK